MSRRWLQIRGDPSIRQFLFSQSRVNNEFDAHLDEVIDSVERLLRERGVLEHACIETGGYAAILRNAASKPVMAA